MSVESVPFATSAHLPGMHEALAWVGIQWPSSPLNLSLLLALLAALGVYALLWRSRAGYRLRAVGSSAGAAAYAGIRPKHQVLIAMGISGALAGLVGMNEIAGVNGKLLLDFVGGAGFTGIAVAVMGRNHPAGIVLASLLFGALFQGGAELGFELPGFSRDMVVMLQGFIVLFSGAMAYVIAPALALALAWLSARLERRGRTEAAHG
jgi:simple sugar transport system permease protein